MLAQHTFPSELDRQEFVISGSNFLALTLASTPNLQSVTGTDPQAYLKILLRATQGTGGDALYGEFSVYAVLRDV